MGFFDKIDGEIKKLNNAEKNAYNIKKSKSFRDRCLGCGIALIVVGCFGVIAGILALVLATNGYVDRICISLFFIALFIVVVYLGVQYVLHGKKVIVNNSDKKKQ